MKFLNPIACYGFGLLLLMIFNTELTGRDYTALDLALTAFIIAVVAIRTFKKRQQNFNDIKTAI